MFFVRRMVSYGYTERYLTLAAYRLYGFSNGLTFATPCIQALLAVITFARIQTSNKKYLNVICGFLLFFSAIINARSAFIVAVLGFAVFIILSRYSLKSKITILIILPVLIIIIINYGLPLLDQYSHVTHKWIVTGIEEIVAFLGGNTLENSYFNYVTNSSKFILPESGKILFGAGYSLLGNDAISFSSDIGYINDMWLGGVVYIILTYSIFLRYMISIAKADDVTIRFIGFLLIVNYLVLNIKGPVFKMNGLTNMLLIIYISCKSLLAKDSFLKGTNAL